MHGLTLALFVLAAFFGGMTSGLAGFAMGLVVSGVWLHIITPLETATLIVAFGPVTQGYAIWNLRHALDWRPLAPYLIGGAFGVPLGTVLLSYIGPSVVRSGTGALLILYGVYGLARPTFRTVKAGFAADLGIGFLNGLLGGLTGLVGIVVTMWCQWRGLRKDAQRLVFQPVILATGLTSLVSFGVAGAITAETVKLFLLAVPFMLAGVWTGLMLYGRLDDVAFRKVVLVLLLVSGLSLVLPLP